MTNPLRQETAMRAVGAGSGVALILSVAPEHVQDQACHDPHDSSGHERDVVPTIFQR